MAKDTRPSDSIFWIHAFRHLEKYSEHISNIASCYFRKEEDHGEESLAVPVVAVRNEQDREVIPEGTSYLSFGDMMSG